MPWIELMNYLAQLVLLYEIIKALNFTVKGNIKNLLFSFCFSLKFFACTNKNPNLKKIMSNSNDITEH